MTAIRRVLLTAALLSAPLAKPPAGAQQEPMRIRLGTMAPQGTSYHRILQEMGERWRTATNGQVQVTIYAGTMGSEAALVRRMRLGQLQAAALTSIGIGEIDAPLKGLQSIPMAFRSVEEQQYVLSRMRPMLERRLLERGFVTLFWADGGWVRYFTRSAVEHPEELRRLKIFVTAGDPRQPDLMRSEGFSPVPLEWSDALTALRTGMIDAIPVIPFYALSMQFYTVASHMVALNWQLLLGGAVIRRSVWESLPPEVQEAMRSAAADAGRRFQERGRLEGDSAVAAMQRRGLTVHTLSPADEADWLAMCERLYPRIRGTLVPADIFDEVMRLRAEYRGQPGARE